MKQIIATKLALSAVVMLALVVVPNVGARAEHGSQGRQQARVEEMQARAETARQEAEARVEEKKAEVKERLDEQRQKVCEQRQQRINAIVDRSVVQANKHLGVFQKIEDRVKTFYESKGATAENYDALVAEADAKELAAVAAIESTKAVEFDCTAEGTQRELGTHMKDLVRGHQTALKEYRTSIKNLIVAVAQSLKDAEAADTEETSEEAAQGADRANTRQEGAR